MKKFLVGCAISTSLLAFSGLASAQEISREGSVLTKVGVQGIFPTAHTKETDADGNVTKMKYKNSTGVELSATYFFTDNFAAELGASYTQYKLKAKGYSDTLKTNAAPVTLMLQYHTPTYGAASPYFGAGYSYAFLRLKKAKDYSTANIKFKAKHVSGPVLQVGSNFDLGEGFGLNLDVKQFWLKPKYTLSIVNENGVLAKSKARYKMNPTVVSLGVTYKF